MSAETEFVERLRELLVNLPYDLKVLFEVISDEDLPFETRELAASAVVYTLSPADAIPDQLGLVGFADDAIYLRLVLRQLAGSDMVAPGYPERFPDQFARLDEDLELFRTYLGEAMSWLEQRTSPAAVAEVKYKGKTMAEYVGNDDLGQMLYEEGLEFTTEYEIDEDAVQRLASGKVVLEAFSRRRQFEEGRRGG